MKVILILIVAIVIWHFFRFILAYIKLRNEISAKGGPKVICDILINGLLNSYSSARVIQDKKMFVTIGGTFTDPIFKRECGRWSFIIQPAFMLNIKYRAYTDLGGGEVAKQMWDFPIDMNQEEILAVIKEKADQWDIYGIYK